jgi:16S rRNA (cytosine967-C5)-methyltransferase
MTSSGEGPSSSNSPNQPNPPDRRGPAGRPYKGPKSAKPRRGKGPRSPEGSARSGPGSRSGPRTGGSRRSGPPGKKLPPRPTGPAADHLAVHPARDAVCRYVIHQVGKFPNLGLADLRLPSGLDSRDAALAHAIYDAVVARWLTLEHLLRAKSDKPWEQMDKLVRATLLVAAAQVLFLDRVPAYAVLDHIVQWTKINSTGGAGRFVNAVMRRIAELLPETGPEGARVELTHAQDQIPLSDGSALHLAQPLLPEDSRERLRIATSHASELFFAWSHLSDEALRARALHSLAMPPVVMNTRHASPQSLQRFDMIQPHSVAGHHVFVGPAAAIASMMAADKGLWVQDAASSHAVRLLDEHLKKQGINPKDLGMVVDLCAGQGTKTRQLRATLPGVEIVATDTDERRLITLAETFAGDDRVKVMPIDKLKRYCAAKAGVVLLDVPCSNTGVLARRPEAKYRYSSRSMQELITLQRDIIDQGMALLRPTPGSVLLYSTCSLEAQENDDQVGWARAKWNLNLAFTQQTEPKGQPGQGPSLYHDGSFAAGLVR